MTIRPLLLCFLLLTGCSVGPYTTPLVAVALTGRPPAKLNDAQIQALFDATSRQVVAAGLLRGYDQGQPVGYTLTLEPIYVAGFTWGHEFGCTSHFGRREALVRFFEYPLRQGSSNAADLESRRRAVRALAARIETSLRRSMPEGFEVRIGVDFPPA